MKIVSEGSKGIAVGAKVSEFSFAQCTVGGTEACTLKPVNLGVAEGEQWIAIFTNGSNGNGTFGLTHSSLGLFGFSVECKGKLEIFCTFTNEATVTGTGGAPATITGAPKMKPVAGTKCPIAEATWKFTWTASEPTPLFWEVE